MARRVTQAESVMQAQNDGAQGVWGGAKPAVGPSLSSARGTSPIGVQARLGQSRLTLTLAREHTRAGVVGALAGRAWTRVEPGSHVLGLVDGERYAR